ncbi:MAG: hypothetical protein NC911_05090 [Candidatus Omnitrophica bacterium]|nr:hypothetical protein [Candidatus Omnitrophota bacterium]
MTVWGLLRTKNLLNPNIQEIYLYSSEGYYTEKNRLRRFTLRLGGLVSVRASGKEGGFVTHPVLFQGKHLVLNYSISAAAAIRVELQREDGKAIPGYSIKDCFSLYGDSLEEVVTWKNINQLGNSSG